VFTLESIPPHKQAEESGDAQNAMVVVDARFPRTYSRSILGIKLTDVQLNQR
jgi:hypothetical protein